MSQGVSFSGEGEQRARADVWTAGELLPGAAGQPASGLDEEGAGGGAGEQGPAPGGQPRGRGQVHRPSDGIHSPGTR